MKEPLPSAPIPAGAAEKIALVPYGCAKFRVSMFPVTERTPKPDELAAVIERDENKGRLPMNNLFMIVTALVAALAAPVFQGSAQGQVCRPECLLARF